jgi:hypothetical protein
MDRVRIYSADTSALIDGLERYYKPSSFPGLWEKVDAELVAKGRLLLSDEVLDEATRKDAAAKEWCKDRKDQIVVPTDAHIVAEVREVLNDFPLMVKAMKGRDRADPFVVAVARLKQATVLTGEGSDGSDKRPKIPYVCRQLDLECIRFTDLIEYEGWQF